MILEKNQGQKQPLIFCASISYNSKYRMLKQAKKQRIFYAAGGKIYASEFHARPG